LLKFNWSCNDAIFVPIMSGTDMLKLQTAIQLSGATLCIVQLEGLTCAHYKDILLECFPKLELTGPILSALKDIEGPPKLLVLFLYVCQGIACFYTSKPSSAKDQNNIPPNLSLSTIGVDKNAIFDFLSDAGTDRLNGVLYLLHQHVLGAVFPTFMRLLTGDALKVSTILAWAAMDTPLPSLATKITQDLTINDLIVNGQLNATVKNGSYYIRIPWIFLYTVWRRTDLPILTMFKTPTRQINSEQAESDDLSALLLKMFGQTRLEPTSARIRLPSFLPFLRQGLLRIEVPISQDINDYTPLIAAKRITTSNFPAFVRSHNRCFIGVKNTGNAPFADWFCYWPRAYNVLACLCWNWDARPTRFSFSSPKPPAVSDVIPEAPLVIFGQSKRYYATSLTADIIIEEYRKVINANTNILIQSDR
jgi:hypothetical protein